jgi:hypothetical protein
MSKVFRGLDYQGRHPQPAEAATEIGADDGLDGTGIVRAVIYGLVAWFAFAAAAVTVWSVK